MFSNVESRKWQDKALSRPQSAVINRQCFENEIYSKIGNTNIRKFSIQGELDMACNDILVVGLIIRLLAREAGIRRAISKKKKKKKGLENLAKLDSRGSEHRSKSKKTNVVDHDFSSTCKFYREKVFFFWEMFYRI